MSTFAHGKRSIWLVIALAVSAILLAAAATSGSASDATDSFSGSCSTQGVVTFSPPIKAQPQQTLTVVYTATGTCSGTLDGKSISNMPVKLQHAGQADASCMHAQTTGPGHGNIYFQNGVVIPYTFQFTDVLTEIAFSYNGQQSGSAHGHGSFATQRTSGTDVVNQCNGGGASQIPMDMTFMTESPLVSGRHGGDGGGDKPPKHSGTTAHSRSVTHHVRAQHARAN
ncbi:MAG: hypothetical protein ACJ768_01220 [Gaiellaceae bacterium]